MVITSAPGKLILLGEHAVVFGKPAIAVAIDLRLKCLAFPADEFKINGRIMSGDHHSYIEAAVAKVWRGDPISQVRGLP